MADNSEHKFEAGSAEAVAAAAEKANYKGQIPQDWLSYKLHEVVRVKGWLFRIEKATKSGRLVLQALPQSEVEVLAKEALIRVTRKQLGNSAEQAEKLKLEEIAGAANMPANELQVPQPTDGPEPNKTPVDDIEEPV